MVDTPLDEAVTCQPQCMSHARSRRSADLHPYVRLQFEGLPESRLQASKSAQLRYCEFDTLAMVMAVQAWDAMADLPQADRHVPRAAASE